MRALPTLCIAVTLAAAGCTNTAILDETTPVRVIGSRPPPPPEPPPRRVEVEETRIRVDEKIHFAFDRADIAPESDDLLREIAQVINDNPQLTRIRIEGHTDGEGTADYNQDLSERRAQAVLERLIENGVDQARLMAVGFGLTRPVADNETDEGRARNRRVEFNILEQTGEPPPASATASAEAPEPDAEREAPEPATTPEAEEPSTEVAEARAPSADDVQGGER